MKNISKSETVNNNNMKGVDNMMNNEIKNTLAVEGFNPDAYKQYYEDGTPYLPFKVQLMWFRLRYPNGKTPVFRPEWSAEREQGTYVATARVYKDMSDPVDSYLSEASAKRGPGIKVQESDTEIDPYNAVQVAALSMALKLAGFWCSLTEEDLTRELKKENDEVEETAETPVETTTMTETPAADDKQEVVTEKRSKRGRKSKAEKEAEATAMAESAAKETTEAPVQEESSNREEVEATESSVNTEATEKVADEQTQEIVDSGAEQATECAVDEKEESVQEKSDADVNVGETVEDNLTEKPADVEIPNSTPVQESTDTKVESEPNVETHEDEIAEESTSEDNIKELEELRAVEFSNGYYNGSIGDLESKKLEGDELCSNLYNWLLNSQMAKRKSPEKSAAARRLAELAHPEWLA